MPSEWTSPQWTFFTYAGPRLELAVVKSSRSMLFHLIKIPNHVVNKTKNTFSPLLGVKDFDINGYTFERIEKKKDYLILTGENNKKKRIRNITL